MHALSRKTKKTGFLNLSKQEEEMPSSRFSGSLSAPRVDVTIDTGNHFVNHTLDGFLKIGAVIYVRFYLFFKFSGVFPSFKIILNCHGFFFRLQLLGQLQRIQSKLSTQVIFTFLIFVFRPKFCLSNLSSWDLVEKKRCVCSFGCLLVVHKELLKCFLASSPD